MGNKIFLYREKSANDRDCCAYIERPSFECGHYFGRIGIHGACYSSSLKAAYQDIDTILTETEYNKLLEYNKLINELGYGITKDDERYQKGLELIRELEPIFDKLESDEASNFFDQIVDDEKQVIMSEYGLDEEELEMIINEYSLDYCDRGIIGYVWRDSEELAMEYLTSCYTIPSYLEGYIDYERFGNDLVNEDYDHRYIELSDGRIVEMNY